MLFLAETATVVTVKRKRVAFWTLLIAPLSIAACGDSVSEFEAAFAKNYLAQTSDALGLSEKFAQCYAQEYLDRANQAKLGEAGITLAALKNEEVALSRLEQKSLFDTPKQYEDVRRESLDCFSDTELKRAVGILEDNDDLNKQFDCIIDDLGREQLIAFLQEAKETPEAEATSTLEASFTFCKEQLIEDQ